MASYVNKKDRVFYPAGDCPPQLHRQRPEASLKTYHSCTDTRVWELAEEPRRQHLRDILSTPLGLQLGNYVPIDMLINILLSKDNDVCVREKDCYNYRSVGVNIGNDILSCICGRDTPPRQIKTCGTQSPPMKPIVQKEDCGDKDNLIKTLNSRIEKMDADLKCAKQRFNENQKEIALLRNDVLEKNKDICEKNNQICVLTDELNAKSQCVAESVNKLELLNNKLHDSECERKELDRKFNDQQKCLQKLQQECINPEKVTEMQRELSKLREYCQFLSKAQEQAEKHSECLNTENQGLKKELRGCHQSLADQSGKLAELHSKADNTKVSIMGKDDEICRLKKDVCRLQEEIRYLNIKLKDASVRGDNSQKCNCSHGAAEEKAKKYKQKFKELEAQLRELSCQCGKSKKDLMIPQVELFEKERDCLQKERDCLQRRVDELSTIEQAYNSLRNQMCEMQNIRGERDMLRMKLLNLGSVEEELERLRFKAKEAECLRTERNRLKQRNDELEAIELQYIELLEASKELECVKVERDRLKCKIEELMRQNLEKQRQICEMETELKQLIAQIDHMSEEEAKQELRTVREQNECLQRMLQEKHNRLKHYTEQFKQIETAKNELKEIQDDIVNSIHDFNIQQKLNDSLYKLARSEHEFGSEHLDTVIEFLTQLVASDDNQDLCQLKCKVIKQITNLKTALDTNEQHFMARLNDVLNVTQYDGHETVDVARSIFGNVLDETHRQYNSEINKMEEIIIKYENKIESLQQLPQHNTCQESLPKPQLMLCPSKEIEKQGDDDLTCLLLHEIEYKTDEIEQDEVELNRLKLKTEESNFHLIYDQINQILLREETERHDSNDLNQQIIDLIRSIERKRNEIDSMQHDLNVMIRNSENETEITKNINAIVRLQQLIDEDTREFNDLKMRVQVTESELNSIHNDEVLKQIRLIQNDIQLKEQKVIQLQKHLKRMARSGTINNTDIIELTALIKSLQNEMEIDQNEIRQIYELAQKETKRSSFTNYLVDFVKKSQSSVSTLLKTEQTFNKYLDTVKKLKDNIIDNEREIKKLYRLIQVNKDHIFMRQTMDRINKLQNVINKHENDILRIFTNLPSQIIRIDLGDEMKDYIFTIQKLANDNLKAQNDLNFLSQQKSIMMYDNSNGDKLKDIVRKIRLIEQRVRKNREKISTITSLMILIPQDGHNLPVHGDINSSVSRMIGDDANYVASIRTVQNLIDQHQTDLHNMIEKKNEQKKPTEDCVQYKNQIYQLQGSINKNMKEIFKLIGFLPDEDLLSETLNDLQTRQLRIFNDYTEILNILQHLQECDTPDGEHITNNREIIEKIQERINKGQSEIRRQCNDAKDILQNVSSNGENSELEVTTIVGQVEDLLCNVETSQDDLEHCEIHLHELLSQLPLDDASQDLDIDKEIDRLQADLEKFNNIISILERCKLIEENADAGKYVYEIEKLQHTVDQLKVKLKESENMVVYIDEIKQLHQHIEKLERDNRIKANTRQQDEMTMNYLQKITNVVDKLDPTKKSLMDSSTNTQPPQINMPKSVDDDGVALKKLMDIPLEVYDVQIDTTQIKSRQEELLNQIKTSEDEKKQYQEEIEALQLKYQNALQDLHSCIASSNDREKQYQEEADELKNKIDRYKVQLQESNDENTSLRKRKYSTREAKESGSQTERHLPSLSSHISFSRIDELEKRIENYEYILQTIGKDGHFSHLFMIMTESIKNLEAELRKAYDQIALLRWNALVDENLTRIAKNCLKELYDKLDESRNEETIQELMSTIRQLETQIQTIKNESKMIGGTGGGGGTLKSCDVPKSGAYVSYKTQVLRGGLTKAYSNADVQTSINLVTGDVYIQTEELLPKQKKTLYSLSKNFVLELDIQSQISEYESNSFTKSEFSMSDALPEQVMTAFVEINQDSTISDESQNQEDAQYSRQTIYDSKTSHTSRSTTPKVSQPKLRSTTPRTSRASSPQTIRPKTPLTISRPTSPQAIFRSKISEATALQTSPISHSTTPQRTRSLARSPSPQFTNSTTSKLSRPPWCFKSILETDMKTSKLFSENVSLGSNSSNLIPENMSDPNELGYMVGGNLPGDSHESKDNYPYANESCTSFLTSSIQTSVARTLQCDTPTQRRCSLRGCKNYLSQERRTPSIATTTPQYYSYRGSHKRSPNWALPNIRLTYTPDLPPSGENSTVPLVSESNYDSFNTSDPSVPITSLMDIQNEYSRPIMTAKHPSGSSKRVTKGHSKSKDNKKLASSKAITDTAIILSNGELRNLAGLRGCNTLEGKCDHRKHFSYRGVPTSTIDMHYFYEIQNASVSKIDLTDPISQPPTRATSRGAVLNAYHHPQLDRYSLRGVPNQTDTTGRRETETDRKYYDKSEMKRYINLGSLYPKSKTDSISQLPQPGVLDSMGIKDSLRGMDDTPLRRTTSSQFDYQNVLSKDGLNEVLELKKQLADFEDRAAKNLINLKMQYERNARALIDEHNRSVSKLSGMQEETIQKLEEENDELRDQIQQLLTKLTQYDNKMVGCSSARTGKIDIPPNHKRLHAMHLHQNHQKHGKQMKTSSGGIIADKSKTCGHEEKKKHSCDEPKKVMICDKEAVCCFENTPSCDNSCFTASTECQLCDEDCDCDCECVCYEDKYVQTKPLPRPKIATTRSLSNILNKFLYEGLQRLDISDLSKLHSRVCYAASVLIEEDREKKMSQEEKVINKIKKMEDQLLRKQKTTQEKINLLEACMQQEKERITVMRAEIEYERQAKQGVPSPENRSAEVSTQVCPPSECTCKSSQGSCTLIPICSSDPCKPKSNQTVCSDPCRETQTMVICSNPCTSSTINVCSKCKSKIFPVKVCSDPCKPKSILKVCSNPQAPPIICSSDLNKKLLKVCSDSTPTSCSTGCKVGKTVRLCSRPQSILKVCSAPTSQKKITKTCSSTSNPRPSKSTSVLCQHPKVCKTSYEPRSTSVLCGSKTKATTADACCGCGISPLSESTVINVKQPTKYKNEEKLNKEKPKDCVCVAKNKLSPATTKTCCTCCDTVASTKNQNQKREPTTDRQTQNFVTKCAQNYHGTAKKQD